MPETKFLLQLLMRLLAHSASRDGSRLRSQQRVGRQVPEIVGPLAACPSLASQPGYIAQQVPVVAPHRTVAHPDAYRETKPPTHSCYPAARQCGASSAWPRLLCLQRFLAQCFRPRPASPPASHQRCRPFGCARFPPPDTVPGPPAPGGTPYRRRRPPKSDRNTSPCAKVRETNDWQFLFLPSSPQQCGATSTDIMLFLGNRIIDYQPGG